MVRRIRAFAAKPGNLTLIPGTHMMEEKKPVLQVVHTCAHGVWPPYTRTHNKVTVKLKDKPSENLSTAVPF